MPRVLAHASVALLGSAVLFVTAAAAQQPGASASIRGRILDPQRQGVQARIEVVETRTDLSRETQSDTSGDFVDD